MATTTVARPVSTPRPTKTKTSRRVNPSRSAWLFATPFLVVYVLFLIGPVVIGLIMSLFNTTTVKSGLGEWVGFANYSDVLTSSDFWSSMWHSTLFTLITTPILVLLPLLFAVLTTRIKHGRTFYRLAFF